MKPARDPSIDVARGLAVVLMISTHAFDGWVAPAARATSSFQLTRFLGILPLPSFLLLAGVGIAMRLERATRTHEVAAEVRRELVRSGLRVVAAGYALSLALGLLDDARDASVLLRGDVLHAIGGSIVLFAWASVGTESDGTVRVRRIGPAVAAALLVVTSPWWTRATRSLEWPWAPLVAPFSEVRAYTRFPIVPLGALLVVGAAVARPMRTRPLVTMASGLALAIAGKIGTTTVHDALGGTLDRTHPAVIANVVDLAGRGLTAVAATVVLSPRMPARIRDWLALLGRHSLLGYAVHLPFAYGRIARPFARRLDMLHATLLFALLVAATTVAVAVAEYVETRRRR